MNYMKLTKWHVFQTYLDSSAIYNPVLYLRYISKSIPRGISIQLPIYNTTFFAIAVSIHSFVYSRCANSTWLGMGAASVLPKPL